MKVSALSLFFVFVSVGCSTNNRDFSLTAMSQRELNTEQRYKSYTVENSDLWSTGRVDAGNTLIYAQDVGVVSEGTPPIEYVYGSGKVLLKPRNDFLPAESMNDEIVLIRCDEATLMLKSDFWSCAGNIQIHFASGKVLDLTAATLSFLHTDSYFTLLE